MDRAHPALLPAGWIIREMLMVLALFAMAGLAGRRHRGHRAVGTIMTGVCTVWSTA